MHTVPLRRIWLLSLALLSSTATLCGPAVARDPTSVNQEHAQTLVREAWGLPDNAARLPDRLRALPIGVFDSGTGGLAALEEILRLDAFDNRTGKPLPQGDGRPDFADERFTFLADQANMPYGNYPASGRTGFLRELVVCDAAFLLGVQYFRRPADAAPAHDRLPVKAIAIACNTATAYGRRDVEALVEQARVPVAVLGVIDAGAQGVVERVDGPASIGVLGTLGTVASGAYPAAIDSAARQRAGKGPIRVFQQGSLGLAGAIDSAVEFLAPDAREPRSTYRGPSLENPLARIDRRLLARYAFDFTAHRMLFEGAPDSARRLQLNAVENYVAYDVTSLLEAIRAASDAPPLAAIVLGCTHFSYVADRIAAKLQSLRDYQEEGRYVYRPYVREKIVLLDPARHMARNLYRLLADRTSLSRSPASAPGQTRGEFYITTAWPAPFTHAYKYGRSEGYTGADVRTVPLIPERLDPATAQRLRHRVPATWRLLDDFSRNATIACPESSRPRP